MWIQPEPPTENGGLPVWVDDSLGITTWQELAARRDQEPAVAGP